MYCMSIYGMEHYNVFIHDNMYMCCVGLLYTAK